MKRPVEVPEQAFQKCAEEKIHVPGAIQSHGVLLAVLEPSMTIAQASEGVSSLFGFDCEAVIGQSLKTIIGEEQQNELALNISDNQMLVNPLVFSIKVPHGEKEFEVSAHRSDGILVIEFEEATNLSADQSLEFFRANDLAIARVLACTTQLELLKIASESVQILTGFERTMIYLFDADWNGTVLAECKTAQAKSYLGLKFPASDIPAQARELYKQQRLRLLVDTEAKPSVIHPLNNPITASPLDLSVCVLRAMSSVHIEYLRNMGVTSSMSISLISQGELRGLIACHHTTAKHVSYRIRRACEFLARLVSLQNDSLQERATFTRLEELRDARKDLFVHLSGQKDLPVAIVSAGTLLDAVGAAGAAVLWDGKCFLVGSTPDEQRVSQLGAHLLQASTPVFVTDCLSKYVPLATEMTTTASGLLAIRLANSGSRWLLWFRPEQLEQVSWAGKNDQFSVDGLHLHPRKSFELWKETVIGKSTTWLSCEVQSALEIRTDLLDLSLALTEKVRAATLEQQVEQLYVFSQDLLLTHDAVMQTSLLKSELLSVGGEDKVDLATIHNLLVVESNDEEFACIELELTGCDVAELFIERSTCLSAALERLKHGGIDLIFLDLSLPDSEGIKAVQEVHRLFPAALIVVLCRSNEMGVALEALKHGAEDYLIKDSLDNDTLSHSIRYAVSRHTARVVSEKLAAIVETTEDAIIGKALDGTIISWNNAASKLFGYAKEEVLGKSISMLVPPEATPELDGILKALARGETIRDLETVRVNKAGQKIEIIATISPILKEDGTVIGAAAIDRDNTERKLTQKVLQESEERYCLLVNKVKDYATFMLDARGFVETWNDGAERLKGYDTQEIIGKHFSIFYTTEDQQNGKPDSHLKVAEAIGSYEETGWRVRKDKSRFFAEVLIIPRFSASHELRGFTKITRDITDRLLAEREVADSKLRLSLALEAAAIGVWDFDVLSNTVWRSPRHDEIFGHRAPLKEWDFDVFTDYVVAEDLALVKGAFKSALKLGTLNLECRIIRAGDGAVRWIAARGQTFWNDGGTPVRMLGTIVDFTEVKEQQEQHRLLAIMNEREDFMATLTHDMKNPLIGANRLLELFIAGSLGELTSQQSEIFQCLKESNSALLKLIADLIDVYRLEKGVNDLLIADCDLVLVISACIDRILPFAKLRPVDIVKEMPSTIRVRADVSRIERVVQNLLDNALKFVSDGGRVTVKVFSLRDSAVIEIEDNGPGIAPEEQLRLFKRFSQGAAGKRYSGGSGLGLYLCKQIVEAHGGTIECQSQPAETTIFRVSLPLISLVVNT